MVLVAVSGNRLLVSESATEGRGLGGLLRCRTKSREMADAALNPVRWSDEDETRANLATSEEHYKRAFLPRCGRRAHNRWHEAVAQDEFFSKSVKCLFYKVSEVIR